jgi:hypothetical protein
MSKEVEYVQVLLAQDSKRMTTWVPTYGITVGAIVTLKPDRDVEWYVLEVYKDNILPESVLKETQRLNRNSLPSVRGTQ